MQQKMENPIKQLLIITGLSTHQVSRITGISQPSISRHVTEIQGISKKKSQAIHSSFQASLCEKILSLGTSISEKKHGDYMETVKLKMYKGENLWRLFLPDLYAKRLKYAAANSIICGDVGVFNQDHILRHRLYLHLSSAYRVAIVK